MSILSVRHLTKSFKKRQIVRDVSLLINSGEIIGLLGPNGAGKTTSFYMIIGIIPCDQGSIYLNNREISALPMDKRARLGLGYLPQEASVFRKLTVAENIMAILQTRENFSAELAQKRLESLLHEFHISHLRDNLGMSLSGGERRRVEIARALAAEPDFLLLDEPFAGIDPISISDIQRTARYLARRGIGVLITDHNVRETLGICDRAYIVIDGQIVREGTPEVILADEQVRSMYLGEQFTL
ncbi:MAG: LPS export ABC transporter ATP-binding protein [Gammaproteobacteria bacterium RIFCSPLOWO2_02_FULL_52_10]|nr:MAG: LPS export ABC transporter ATP-binding protein [Gammaproteobacteria bacterium RIFCSPLOWO2_02_FULL_52_10]OGT85338.1 MAG: LPS export ABC transporter ATP-binding protein [Gammaproteobacteria bacterium RIFCSPLOWO2_12_FULL_52_10]